ncbi:ATP-binding cassette domain-containing protein [Paracoccus stylophorae]|uniref:ATP-binding cassette domain-containing protein n=1 Tax=Paracoccus stylophorae TaxID=659350 RepID=A0ABY7SYP9_9RHOB|nr:ATP-binding cassette domain-containing protein [Paracoccus stylophorae]WCR12151.1 ATP-binding cassette domain-containing protein [Paracoccus stylophorae]
MTSPRQTEATLSALTAPPRRRLRRAAAAAVLAEALWLPQAALLAWALAAMATGAALQTGWAILGVAGLGCARAGLGMAGAAQAEIAADAVIGAARAECLERADRRAPEADAPSSAATAALIVDKLAMLRPWLLRWHPARARVAVVPLLILAVSFAISWIAGLILAISGPLIPVFMALIGLAARDASARQMDEITSLNALLVDRLGALVDIRLLEAREAMLEDFRARADRLRARTMRVLRIAFLSSAVLELFAALGVAMMAVYVGFSLLGALNFGAWGAPMTMGEGIFLLLLAPAFFQPLRDVAAAWHDRIAAQAVAADLLADRAVPVARILGQGGPALPLSGTITVRGLAIRDLRFPDLDIAPGEAVALTGPSGAGKTTLLLALAGMIPSHGAIRVGDVALTDATADRWRAGMAMIPQRVHFLDFTLRENLSADAPDDRIAAALDLAQAAPIVARLPQGLGTRLGEQGAGVSGGEARRLTIARAALRAPAVILADEPTADLDDATAAQVIAGLRRLHRQGATLIVASHDPRLIAELPRRIEVRG